ncbi:MAG: hypothetical protein HYX43_14175 [Burkholderiales bacterium]|nr:hypothetical protein [Burkholderiales bacterium]
MFNLRAAHRSSTPLPETPIGRVFWLNCLDIPMMGIVKLATFRMNRPAPRIPTERPKASGPLMRFAFLAIQLLDGFANTQDSFDGRPEPMFGAESFIAVSEVAWFGTVFGPLSLFRAVNPRRTPFTPASID